MQQKREQETKKETQKIRQHQGEPALGPG